MDKVTAGKNNFLDIDNKGVFGAAACLGAIGSQCIGHGVNITINHTNRTISHGQP
jgi:hypothetical protein